MNPGLLLLIIFVAVLFLNVPIAFALGVAAMAVMYFCGTFSLDFMAQISFNAADSFTLLAVPFFVLAGDIMVAGGISNRLVKFGTVMLSSTRGALGMITHAATTLPARGPRPASSMPATRAQAAQ